MAIMYSSVKINGQIRQDYDNVQTIFEHIATISSKLILFIAILAISQIASINNIYANGTKPHVIVLQQNNLDISENNVLYTVQSNEISNLTPMPANWKQIRQIKINDERNHDDVYTFNVISIDGNDQNYEIVEFISKEKNVVFSRGIIKDINLCGKKDGLWLYGIKLDTHNLNNYNPEGKYTDIKNSSDLYDLMDMLRAADSYNKAIKIEMKKTNYSSYEEDLQQYKKQLNKSESEEKQEPENIFEIE